MRHTAAQRADGLSGPCNLKALAERLITMKIGCLTSNFHGHAAMVRVEGVEGSPIPLTRQVAFGDDGRAHG